jgi:hypothetical protein
MPLTAENFRTGAIGADRDALNLALFYLSQSPTANSLMQYAADNGVTINIVHGSEETTYFNGVINWNPSVGIVVIANPSGGSNLQSDSVAVGVRSPELR